MVIVIALFAICLFLLWNAYAPAGREGHLIQLTIPDGSSAYQVAGELEEKGLVKSQNTFMAWLMLSGRWQKLQPGTYYLPTGASINSLTRLMTGAVSPAQEIEFRIGEGWRLAQIGFELEKMGLGKASDFAKLVSSQASVGQLLKDAPQALFAGAVSQASFEGYLFPDTYRLDRAKPMASLVQKAIDNFRYKFSSDMVGRAKSIQLSIHEILTLASIVELEVPSQLDRELVADIFLRRLKVGMRLQADSTVNYVTGKSLPAVTTSDLAVKSPYNTYQVAGLPPGPIGQPSLSSIRAVLYAKDSDAWYFLTTSEGKVIYSSTYAEHLAAKRKYLRSM